MQEELSTKVDTQVSPTGLCTSHFDELFYSKHIKLGDCSELVSLSRHCMVMATNSFHQITKYAIWLSHVTFDPTQCEHELILNKEMHVKWKIRLQKYLEKRGCPKDFDKDYS